MGDDLNPSRLNATDLAAALVAALAVAVFFCLHPEGNTDLFWHLTTGEGILQRGALPSVDPYSFTALGRPWFNHEWLAEVIFFQIWKLGGFVALSFFSCGVGILLALALFAGARRVSRSNAVALSVVLVVFALGAPRFQILRPDFLAFLFFAATLGVLIQSGGARSRWLMLLPPLFVLWANVHASAIIGPPVVLVFLAASAWRRPPGENRPPAGTRFIAAFVALLALAPMLNPYGIRIYLFPFEHLLQRYSIAVTNDWAILSWIAPRADLAAWGMAMLAAVCVLLAWRRRDQLNLPLLLVAAFCAIPGFVMLRFVPFAAIALALFFASLLGHGARPSTGSGQTAKGRRYFVTILVVCFALPLLFFRVGPVLGLQTSGGRVLLVLGRPMGVGFGGEDFPVEAVDAMEEAGIQGRFFNDMAWGGYLVWRRWPGGGVFIDTRTPVYGDAFIRSYGDALFSAEAFEKIVREWNLRGVLYDVREMEAPGGPLQFLFDDPRWVTAFRSPNTIVLLRKGDDPRLSAP